MFRSKNDYEELNNLVRDLNNQLEIEKIKLEAEKEKCAVKVEMYKERGDRLSAAYDNSHRIHTEFADMVRKIFSKFLEGKVEGLETAIKGLGGKEL